jgi:predicted RNase H-like HicB family nuclease/predicted RNA binding protein YcfA (HicA-like mRNA interferase family)
MRYTVVLEQESDGGHVVSLPALPGCVSQGDSRAEALANIRDAIELYIEDCREAGDPIPTEAGREFVRGRSHVVSRLPADLSGRAVRSALERAGFVFRRQSGSHMILRRDAPAARPVVRGLPARISAVSSALPRRRCWTDLTACRYGLNEKVTASYREDVMHCSWTLPKKWEATHD